MKINNIEGEVVKDNDVYILKDNTDLKSLVLSSTLLHPGKSTRGHSHPGQEEIYDYGWSRKNAAR